LANFARNTFGSSIRVSRAARTVGLAMRSCNQAVGLARVAVFIMLIASHSRHDRASDPVP
jgi:hypothetical protein